MRIEEFLDGKNWHETHNKISWIVTFINKPLNKSSYHIEYDDGDVFELSFFDILKTIKIYNKPLYNELKDVYPEHFL